MVNWREELSQWRIKRNMDNNEFVVNIEIANLLEECTEHLRANTPEEQIDALCDITVYATNALFYIMGSDIPTTQLYTPDKPYIGSIVDVVSIIMESNVIDTEKARGLSDIIHICHVLIEHMGYDYVSCMLETLKEISSREQCPIQAEEWKQLGKTGKWEKDKQQDSATLYKADYESCIVPF